MSPETPVIYTIGHGRHSFEVFLSLLKRHGIRFLIDVRSRARSRWPQYNERVLERALGEEGIGYEHLPECGGKVIVPAGERARGIDRIMEIAGEARSVIMCSESMPLTRHTEPRANCHRIRLLAVPLKARGARVIHILPDGETVELDEMNIPSIW